MRVEYSNDIALEDVEVGECFQYFSETFLKTDETQEKGRLCVRVHNGIIAYFTENCRVEPVNAKVVIE